MMTSKVYALQLYTEGPYGTIQAKEVMVNTDDFELLLPTPKFSKALGITPSCTRKWIREKRIAVVHLGRLVRIPKSELNRLIELGTTPARQNPTRATRVNTREKAPAMIGN